MKKIIFLCFSLLATFSFANEKAKIGEILKLQGTVQGQPVILEYAITAYDQTKDTYKVQTSFIFSAGTHVENEWVPSENLMNRSQGRAILTQCKQIGGILENLVLPVGKYQACKLAADDIQLKSFFPFNSLPFDEKAGFAWLGDFPVYGIAQFQNPELTLKLIQFTWKE